MASAVLNLVLIRSPDLERAGRFYAGLGVSLLREKHGSGPEHLSRESGGVVFEIYPQGDAASTLGVRLGFRVASLADALAAAAAQGGAVLSPPRESPWGLRAVVADPDGHRVELTQAAPSA